MKINESNFAKELKRKNEDALEFVVTNYGKLIKSVINRVLYDCPEDAEECFYDVILKIWKNTDRHNENLSFRGWLVVIAKHTALDRLRKIKKYEPMVNIDELSIADKTDITGDKLFDDIFAELISCLNDEDKILFTRMFWYGESIDEISKKTGISKSNTYNRISRGKKRIIKFNPALFRGGSKNGK